MLKSRDTLPPQGWVFVQPQTGWRAPFGLTFDQTVDAIIKHRSANPRFNLSLDWNTVANELEWHTVARLMNVKGGETYLTGTNPPKPSSPHSLVASSDAGVAGAKPKITAGIPVLINWLGHGLRPVEQTLAETRAGICATCPQNQKGDWKHFFTEIVASVLRLQIEIKNDMNLHTSHDQQLNVCQACLCELPLKVWTPLYHITDHLPDDMRSRLDPRCWILHE